MSKLKRKEFKKLLTEWRSNFINEDASKKQNLVKFFDFAKLKLLPCFFMTEIYFNKSELLFFFTI